MEAAAEYEGQCPDREKIRERRDKERRKEMAKVEKEKESDEGKINGNFRQNNFREMWNYSSSPSLSE